MKVVVFALSFCCCLSVSQGQLSVTWNANLDMELTKAGSASHYFLNEIHATSTDWLLDIARANFSTKLSWDKDWTLNALFWLEPTLGQRDWLLTATERYKLDLPVLYLKKEINAESAISIGAVPVAFGRFYQDALYKDRSLLSAPLSYSYYINASPFVGLAEKLGDTNKLSIAGNPEWGLPMLYQLGYKTGIRFDYQSEEQFQLAMTLHQGSLNSNPDAFDFSNWGFSTRLVSQPFYFSKFGFSLAHGTFQQDFDLNKDLAPFTQTLLGMDVELGSGNLELAGEIVASHYKTPVYDFSTKNFSADEANYWAWSGYFDLKYDVAFVPSLYVALRWEWLNFGEAQFAGANTRQWDVPVRRESIGVGYKIKPYWMVKSSFAWQQIGGKPANQELFRVMSILHW